MFVINANTNQPFTSAAVGPHCRDTTEISLPSTLIWETLFEFLDGDIKPVEQSHPETLEERSATIRTLQARVSALCAHLTMALRRHRSQHCHDSHVVALYARDNAGARSDNALEFGGVGIDVFSSIRRVELQIWDEHLPSGMLPHEACARLFYRKFVNVKQCFSLSASTECVADMTSVVQTLLNNYRIIKTRLKCLSDISKLLQRCRTQSIHYIQLHISGPAGTTASSSQPDELRRSMPDVESAQCTDSACTDSACTDSACTDSACTDSACTDSAFMVAVPTLTTSVVDNVLYGRDTFPATAAESELVAVLWMFVRDYHARPNILSRMICYNTWKMSPLLPVMGVSLSLQVWCPKAPRLGDTDSRGGGAGRYFSLTSSETWVIIYAFFHGEVISKLLNYSAALKGERSMVDVRMSATPVDRLTMTVNVHQRSERHFRAQQRNHETINYQ